MISLENIIIMKCGTHAGEKINDIFNRKKKEEKDNGFIYWGYGGTLCHPLNQVQPFCKNSKKVYLLLTPTNSELNNEPKKSNYFSIDNKIWNNIDTKINVFGSKYALVINNLQKCDFYINLSEYEIAIGNSKGKNLAEYLNGRVDKACASKINNTNEEIRKIKIVMVAELLNPYSIFVK